MKQLFFTTSLLFGFFSVAQTYPGMIISDGKKADLDNELYIPGRTFTYFVEGTDSTSLPEEISYTVLTLRNSKKLMKNQTEVAISKSPFDNRLESTGIVENKENVWLHPPRTGPFNDLAICPFPYVSLPLEKGNKWNDKNVLGDQWSNGRWNGRMACDIQYQVVDKKEVKTKNSSYDCWIIEGVLTSEVGVSKATFSFNEEMGFIHMAFETIEQDKFSFILKSTTDSAPFNSLEEVLLRIKEISN